MRELRVCTGCDGEAFGVVSTFAGELALEPVEIVVWRCDGCGEESHAFETVVVEIAEARRASPRAA